MKASELYASVEREGSTVNVPEVVARHSELVRRVAYHLAARLPASGEVTPGKSRLGRRLT